MSEWIPINVNENIKIKLTDRAKDIYYHQYDEFLRQYPHIVSVKPHLPKVDEDGFTTMQLWTFMELYGKEYHIGGVALTENNEIYFEIPR